MRSCSSKVPLKALPLTQTTILVLTLPPTLTPTLQPNLPVQETQVAGFKAGIDLPCPEYHDGPGNPNRFCQIHGERAWEICRDKVPACGVS